MNKILLALILLWSVFWLGYAINIYNNEEFYIKRNKKCTKADRPILFHAEVIVSVFWSLSGYVMLFIFLQNNI